MNDELYIQYLYFLTNMYAGTDKWRQYYKAWSRFAGNMDAEKYSKIIDDVRALHNKYRYKKKRLDI